MMTSTTNTTCRYREMLQLPSYYWLVFVGCWVGGIFDGMDSNMFPVLLPNILHDILHTTDKAIISHAGSVITCVFLLGWTAGGVLIGFVGDKLGRVKSMVLSILLYSIFTGLVGLTHTVWQLAICRFLTGLGIGGELVSISTLLSEVWPERSRAFIVGILITSYQAGVLLSGLVSQWVPDWRWAFFAGAIPAVLALLLRLKLSEPEKWLEEKNRQVCAGEKSFPLITIFEPQYRQNLILGSFIFGGLLIGYWASLVWIPTWIQDLITRTPGIISNGHEKSIATVYHSIGGIMGCTIAGLLADKIGRRVTIVVGVMGGFITSVILFTTNPVFSTLIYWQDFILGLFISILQAIIYIYLPELFPTKIRATGVGFCLNVGRVAASIACLYMGTLVLALGGYAQAALVFSVAYLLTLIAVLFAPETKGKLLPQ